MASQNITSKYETVAAFSGGANRGAELLGYMVNMRFKYDAIVTNSVTSLMSLHLKTKKFREAARIFQETDHSNVFSRSPFLDSGQLNPFVAISLGFHILFRDILKLKFLFPKPKLSLGDSTALRKHLDKHVSIELFNEAKFSEGDVLITIYDQTNHKKKYLSIKDLDFEEFKDVMWYSANAPIFMNHEYYRGNLVTDGGVTEVIPATKAVELASKRVECYICRSHEEIWGPKNDSVNNMTDNLDNLLAALMLETIKNDLTIAREKAKNKGLEFCEYYLCDKKSYKPYLFHNEILNDLLSKAGHRKLKTQRIN